MNNQFAMYKNTLIFFLFVSSFTFQLRAQNNHSTQIDSLLEVCHKRGIFNGNALVIKNDETIYRAEKGFTDGSKMKKLSEKSIFDIGSISKEFNAVGIMMLKEKGLLSLNDKLSKYQLDLPDWSNKISIKHLLQYSSGLPQVNWEAVHSDSDVYKRLQNLKALKFEPGTGYLYSNNNIFLQKRIIEKITGKTFDQFLKQDILQPIGMNSSVIDHQYGNPDFVRGFNSKGINDKKLELKMSGWVCPSIGDLAKWGNQLLSYNIISKESLYQLFEAYSKESQSALGNGTFSNKELTSYVHHGSSLSYESIIYYDVQEKVMIVLMTNSKSLKIGDIAEAIMHIVKNENYEVPQKSVYLTIREKTYQNVDEGIAYYKSLKKSNFDTYNFSNQWELARLSYKLFEKNQSKSAIKILELLVSELPKKSEETIAYLGGRILNENQIDTSILIYQLMIKEFPSGKSYSGLGDAYYKDKQFKKALFNYKKSLELEPENEKSKEMILKIEKM
ncbi:serine hydrolase [Tenacibaculum agarivorans]|uniref:serine hydrolase n=1 Tax=Tenacibaculum agarivorans TaxID=1908389 RepID=UPI000A9BCC89|nr:serine hydrolase [Tenacibaculum agarivorans]